MSQHAPPHAGDVYAHSEQNHAKLAARYPDQFSGENIGLSWPDGWHRIVANVCAYAHEHQFPVQWHQIKEKFGCLRMYYRGGPLRMEIERFGQVSSVEVKGKRARVMAGFHDQVQAAESKSLKTCCRCGTSDAASAVSRRPFNGWWLTSCDACAVVIQAYCDLSPRQR
ncbi:hypothetical protein [Sinimarinibacterium thermocellulolyticum]|jgi:hypothetical protein|uniref:Uncharacterized protein n=1 Tax=Sinimarinibacterium thermocellulolyticum TaxID=3170016 RepID=A0ABV2ADQ8_9GAMM